MLEVGYVKRNGRDLFQRNISAFVWRVWEELKNLNQVSGSRGQNQSHGLRNMKLKLNFESDIQLQ